MDSWSFHRLDPTTLGWLGLAGGGIVLALFLLRPRVPLIQVSSHVLWEEVLRKTSNPLVKEWAQLALQLLAVGALVLALGEPQRVEEEPGAAARVPGLQRLWVVDRSLSMGALDPEYPSRLDRVRDELLGQLDSLPDTVELALIGAGGHPQLLAPLGADRARIGLALRLLELRGQAEALGAAMDLAAALPGLRPKEAVIEVFTDEPHAEEVLAAFAPDWAGGLRLRAPFSPQANLGLLDFDLRGTEGIPAEEEAFVRICNYAPWPARAELSIETQDAVLGIAALAMDAGEVAVRRYRFRPEAEGGPVEAVLRQIRFDDGSSDDTKDGLSVDDRTAGWIEPVSPIDVVLITRGNRYLQNALALLPGARLRVFRPADYVENRPSDLQTTDLVVFDGWAPKNGFPPRALFIAPPAGTGPFATLGSRRDPAITEWNHSHPLFEGLVLRDLQVRTTSILEEQPGDVRLLAGPTGPLALARREGERRWVGWGFDLAQSDFPLRLAFPQWIVNTVLWMRAGRTRGEAPGQRQALGDALWVNGDKSGALLLRWTDLQAEAAAEAAGDARAAKAAEQSIPLARGATPAHFARPGFYRVDSGESQDPPLQLAVQTSDASEGAVGTLPTHDSRDVPLPVPPAPPAPGPSPWLLLAGFGILALSLEFGLYTR